MPPARLLAASLALVFFSVAAQSAPPEKTPSGQEGLSQIRHVVVFYLENRSFDNLYGLFPGADGLQDMSQILPQVDADGMPYETLPRALNSDLPKLPDGQPTPIQLPDGKVAYLMPKSAKDAETPVDTRIPPGLPNKPFRLDQYIPLTAMSGDLVHAFFTEQRQIHGGKMDRFVSAGNSGGLPMGYSDGSSLPMWKLAKEFTLADHFFHGAFGGSFINHFWLICACTPEISAADWATMDQAMLSDPPNQPVKDRAVWLYKDRYWGINTIQSVFEPHDAKTPGARLLPPQYHDTIGDRLSEKGLSWAWYSGGWNDAIAGRPDPSFQFHHQPFAYFAKYGDGTPGRAEHLKDEADLVKAIQTDTLPAVAFWKPIGRDNEHPGYSDVMTGDIHAAEMVERIRKSPAWKSTVIIVTYDEHGGAWDHVAPPTIDEWGPGTRIPTIIISPFAKKGFVDHTVYNTDSILAFIEARFGLKPLGSRDESSEPLSGAFAFKVERSQ